MNQCVTLRTAKIISRPPKITRGLMSGRRTSDPAFPNPTGHLSRLFRATYLSIASNSIEHGLGNKLLDVT